MEKVKLPTWVVDEICHSLRHLLLSQSSYSADYIREADFSLWDMENVEFIKNSLNLIENKFKSMEIRI